MAPLATAVIVLLAPATARATSDSPDPAPGATVLQPDRPPTAAAPAAKPAPRSQHVVVEAALPVERTVAVAAVPQTPVVTAPPRQHVAAPPSRTHKAVKPVVRPHKHTAPIGFKLPPVLSPAFLEPDVSGRGATIFAAAVALALAALTACSGAGLVVSWSRH